VNCPNCGKGALVLSQFVPSVPTMQEEPIRPCAACTDTTGECGIVYWETDDEYQALVAELRKTRGWA
jgi:hypothetical protein